MVAAAVSEPGDSVDADVGADPVVHVVAKQGRHG